MSGDPHSLGTGNAFAGTAGLQVPSLPALLFATSSAACWGIGVVAAKGALAHGVDPLSLVVIQLAASLSPLSVLALLRMQQINRPTPRNARDAAFSGVLEYGATYALAAFGLALTTAGNAALIGAAEPALIVLIAALMLRERLSLRMLVLLALVTAGLGCVVWPDLASAGQPGFGDMLVLGSAATGAVYAVLSRRLVRDIAPLPLSIVQQFAGLFAVVVGVFAAKLIGWSQADVENIRDNPLGLGLAILSGVLQHGAAVWLHLHALKRMPAGTVALFLALVPVFALLTASLFLNESVVSSQIVGGALIVTAAALVRSTARRASDGDREPSNMGAGE